MYKTEVLEVFAAPAQGDEERQQVDGAEGNGERAHHPYRYMHQRRLGIDRSLSCLVVREDLAPDTRANARKGLEIKQYVVF